MCVGACACVCTPLSLSLLSVHARVRPMPVCVCVCVCVSVCVCARARARAYGTQLKHPCHKQRQTVNRSNTNSYEKVSDYSYKYLLAINGLCLLITFTFSDHRNVARLYLMKTLYSKQDRISFNQTTGKGRLTLVPLSDI